MSTFAPIIAIAGLTLFTIVALSIGFRADRRVQRAQYRAEMHRRADESLRVYTEKGPAALLEMEPPKPFQPHDEPGPFLTALDAAVRDTLPRWLR